MKGIFLGTFNPPHIGHVSICSEVLNKSKNTLFPIDSIDVIPAYQNPNKNIDTTSSFEFRCQLCKNIFQGLKNVVINPLEGVIKPKYTWSLFNTLKTMGYYNDFVWIITTETFFELIQGKWFASTDLINTNKFIIVNANHSTIDNEDIKFYLNNGKYSSSWKDRMVFITLNNKINISSTIIRDKLANNEIVYPYVFNVNEKLLCEFYRRE